MKLKPHQRVAIDLCRSRALAALRYDQTTFANAVAIEIWPDHQMTSQGAGAAASRILRRLQKDGLVEWHTDGLTWGWRLTTAGRDATRKGKA